MTLSITPMDMPKTTRVTESKYPFQLLVAGGSPMIDNEVIDRSKAQSRVTSALVAYRKRTGDKSKFAVRTFAQADGTDAVGVWKLADAA